MEDTWRHREACVKAKRSCEGGMFVQWLDKNLDGFTPKRYLGCVLHVRVFWSFSRCLYIYMEGLCGQSTSLTVSHLEFLSFVLRARVGER